MDAAADAERERRDHIGLGAMLTVLALVVVVQQVDGNVVQSLVMGRATRLSAFTVLVAVSAGAALLGVLGAFLAVPVAACISGVLAFLRDREAGRGRPARRSPPAGDGVWLRGRNYGKTVR